MATETNGARSGTAENWTHQRVKHEGASLNQVRRQRLVASAIGLLAVGVISGCGSSSTSDEVAHDTTGQHVYVVTAAVDGGEQISAAKPVPKQIAVEDARLYTTDITAAIVTSTWIAKTPLPVGHILTSDDIRPKLDREPCVTPLRVANDNLPAQLEVLDLVHIVASTAMKTARVAAIRKGTTPGITVVDVTGCNAGVDEMLKIAPADLRLTTGSSS